MKLTITNKPVVKSYTSKAGKPYKKVFIKTQEYGADLISGFYRQEMDGWKEGDAVEVESVGTPTISTDGKTTFRNFEMPKKEDQNALLKKTYENTEQILNVLAGLKIDLHTKKAPTEDEQYAQYAAENEE